MRTTFIALATLSIALAPLSADAKKKCSKKGRVFVKAKTPLRRGPGLNYPVSSFLEKGRCVKLEEVSLDENWVMVKGGSVFGWVARERLDNQSIRKVDKLKPTVGPVGSGQTRGYVNAKRATSLYEAPGGDPKKEIASGTKLLALSITKNEAWVEVRDERSETGWVKAKDLDDPGHALRIVPRSDAGVDAAVSDSIPAETTDPNQDATASDPNSALIDKRSASGGEGLAVFASVLAGAAVPLHSLDSNGNDGVRRYDINAFGGTGKVEAGADGLGPLRGRLGYGFTFLTNIEAEDGGAISGTQHEGRIILGLPIPLGSGTLVPELGYNFLAYDFDPALPGAPVGQFFSSRSHMASVGSSLQYWFGKTAALDLEAAFLIGASDTYPFDLGDPGVAFGVLGSVGGRIAMSNEIDIVLRYDLRYTAAGFSGQSALDPTITEASLNAFVNGFFGGMSFTL